MASCGGTVLKSALSRLLSFGHEVAESDSDSESELTSSPQRQQLHGRHSGDDCSRLALPAADGNGIAVRVRVKIAPRSESDSESEGSEAVEDCRVSIFRGSGCSQLALPAADGSEAVEDCRVNMRFAAAVARLASHHLLRS